MALNAWLHAQQSVIGSLLLEPRCAGEIFQRAKPEHFGDSNLRQVFIAARALWNDNRPVDPVTILHAAGDQHHDLLADCLKLTPTAANFREYLGIIASSSRLNAMQTTAQAILFAQSEDEASSLYEKMGQQVRDTGDVEDVSWGECVQDYFDRMSDKTPVKTLNWGIPQLDRFLNTKKGLFVILAADSSVGKTALALQFAYNMAVTGQRVGFFSLETDTQALTDRLMAQQQVAGINLPRSKNKALTDSDYERAMAVGTKSDKLCFRLIRNADTIPQIRAHTVMHNLDVIFIDYVQLINAPGRERWDIVTNVSIQLHRMAQQLGVTIVGLSQITPPSKDSKKTPSKDDLRESRQLKHDADIIMIMSISQEGAGVFRELNIAKNKDGPLATVLLDFDAEHMSFKYRPPAKPNPYAEVHKAAKTAAKKTKASFEQIHFEELPPENKEENPF